MDFPVPQPIIDGLHKVVNHKIYSYSLIPDEYYEAIQYWFAKRYDWDIKKDEIIYSPGTVHALDVAIKAFSKQGDTDLFNRLVVMIKKVYF